MAVGLHVHGEHSFLDGLSRTDQIAQRAKELGQAAVALTDHGECSGHLSFEKSCQAEGVKPIFGMEGYLSHNIKKQKAEKDRLNSHIVLLAENQTGLSNLWSISSLAYREENFYYKPLADWEMFGAYGKGLIATSACMLSFMARAILAEDKDTCRHLISRYQETFGENNFFLELHTWQIMNPESEKHEKLNSDMSKINQGLVQLGNECSVPLIVVNDAHYSWPEQAENHQLVWQMSTNQDQVENKTAAAHIMGDDEIIYWMQQHGVNRSETERAIANTEWVGERCNAEIPRRPRLPRITDTAEDDRKLFLDAVEAGYQRKVVDAGLDESVYGPRKDDEIKSITDKGFDGYINVVSDYCKYAKTRTADKEAWLVGPARGSAGGSLVLFLLDITELDPVKYDLLFARFISPGRKGYPDIDLDFPQSKRELLKQYFEEKYGSDHVCGIGTLARLHAKSALRDIAKTQGIDYPEVNAMAKIIDKVKNLDGHTPTWDEIMDAVGEELKPWIEKHPYLFQKVRELNGLVRQSGTHASGLIISNEPLLGNLPIRRKAGNTVTQFEYQECEELGFIKFDVLGVRHLDTLTEAWKLRHRGSIVEFDPRYYYDFGDEQYTDESALERVSNGDTLGIFQIETPLGASTAKKLIPENERDFSALLSVVRPGVIGAGLLDEFIARRHGTKRVAFAHPFLEEILGKTHGICVYQEQVMKIVVACGNYTLEEADRFRKMMGKKLYEDMKAERPVFIERCANNLAFVNALGTGRHDARRIAGEIWLSIEASGAYSFNEAHGQGYALVCAWGAYEAANHFPEYLTALLRTDPEKVARYIKELRKNDYSILPPDVNQSDRHFTLTDAGLRFGLTDIHYVSEVAYKDILANRPFESFEDYLAKRSKRACNSRVTEHLIKIGAFETLGPRETHLRKFYEAEGRLNESVPRFTKQDIQTIEKELVGIYITSDPIEEHGGTIREICLPTPDHVNTLNPGELANIGGQVTLAKEHNAKNGLMCFLEVTFEEQTFPVTIFADKYAQVKMFIEMDAPIVCQVVRLQKGVMLRDLVRLDW